MGLVRRQKWAKEPNMDLAKTISSCHKSTRRDASRLQIIGGLQKICTKCTTYKMFIELALPMLWGICMYVSLFSFSFFSLFFWFFYIFFTCLLLLPQLYNILYENNAQNFCSEFYKVHVQSPSNHKRTSLNRCFVNTRIFKSRCLLCHTSQSQESQICET